MPTHPNLHLAILKALLESTRYQKYESSIDLQAIREEAPEVFKVFQALIALQKTPGDYSLDDLRFSYATSYPASNTATAADAIIQQMADIQVQDSAIEGYLDGLHQRTQALAVAKAALGFAEGHKTREEYESVL